MDTTDRAMAIKRLQEKLSGEWLETEHITEMLRESLETDHHIKGMDNVPWSLSNSQGDGVAFEGHLDLDYLRKHQPELDEMIGNCEALVLLSGAEYELENTHCEVGHYGNYYHENSMNLDIEWNNRWKSSTCPTPLIDWLNDIEKWLERYIKNVSRALARLGYEQIEFYGSEEHATEYLDANPEVLDLLELTK